MNAIRRRLFTLAVLVAASVAVSLAAPEARAVGAGPSRASGACANSRPVDVPLQGPSCRVDGGWEIQLSDGSSVFTHGVDPPHSHIWQPPHTPPVAPKCISDPDRDYHSRVIYARPKDRPNRYSTMLGEIRTMVDYANGIIDAEAEKFGRSLSHRMRCDATGKVEVVNVTLSTDWAATTYASVEGDLQDARYANERTKYWVWVDLPINGGGQGSIRKDSSPLPSNNNNYGGSYALTYGTRHVNGGGAVMAHENGHNLGAVQETAPNNSGAGHCNDGHDYMCYQDGGALSALYRPTVCPAMTWDCRNDDYFHPDPPPTNYLAHAWNLASPVNRYLQGCAYVNGTLAAAVGQTTPSTATHSIPPDCAGLRYALSAQGVMSIPDLTLDPGVPDMDVCWYADDVLLRCDARPGFELDKVPAGTTRAEVIMSRGTTARYILSIV